MMSSNLPGSWMRCGVLLLGMTVGCSWPDHQFASEESDGAVEAEVDSSIDASVGDAATETMSDVELPVDDTAGLPKPTQCPPAAETAGFCAELREFFGTYALDGAGDEFCREVDAGPRMPPRRFTVTESARTYPSPPPAGLAEKFEVRAGLDAYGVHVFVQVLGDPRVIVDRDDPMQGDAVEIFVRGVVDPLNGSLETDSAQHLVLTPPTPSAEGIGWRYLDGVPKVPIAGSQWRSRRVKGGWEVELHQPWTDVKNQPAPGMVMGFDIGIDLDDDPTKPGRDVRVLMHVGPVASSASCSALGIASADPLCDDRTWCLAKAYIP